MKFTNFSAATLLSLGLGFAGLLLQHNFFLSTDEKGLLNNLHLCALLTFLVSAAFVTCLALILVKQEVACRFYATPVSGIGAAVTACGILAGTWALTSRTSLFLTVLAVFLGLLSSLCLGYAALLRFRKQRAHPLLHCPAVAFCMLMLICMYQQWSGEPELLRYCYPLLALVFLMLSFYHRAALKVGIGNHKLYFFFSRSALFFCLVAIPSSFLGIFYGCTAVGIVLDGCDVLPAGRREE